MKSHLNYGSLLVPVTGLDLHLRYAQIIVRLRQAVAGGAHPRRN